MPMLVMQVFGPEVDSKTHPKALEYWKILQEGCRIYGGRMTAFAVQSGVVACSLTSEEMVKDMLEDKRTQGFQVEIVEDEAEATVEIRKMLGLK
jgi:hypothetical protein